MRPIPQILALLLLLWSTSWLLADGTTTAPPTTTSSTATTQAEAELGNKTAQEIEKAYKLIQDDKVTVKLNAMAAEIAPYTQRPDVVYQCRILDSNEINAMSIPGGIIYFTKGLLDAVESDSELAGVMAHEMAHNSLYHVKQSMEQDKKASITQLLSIVAAIYMKDNATTKTDDVNSLQLIMVSEFVKQAVLNGYTKEMELQADNNAVQYLAKAKKYDPTGIYSVMLGFRKMEATQPKTDLGYIQNHPDPQIRMDAIKKEMQAMHLPINLWNVVNFRASVIPPADGQTGYTLRLGTTDIFTYRVGDDTLTVEARANAAADAINRRLTRHDDEIERYEVYADTSEDGKIGNIRLRNTTVLTLLPADVEQTGYTSLGDLMAALQRNIQTAIFNEKVKRGM